VKASFFRWSAAALAAVVLSLPAAATDKLVAPSYIYRPQKAAPAWLKIIDQGDLGPRLKGYKTPEGIKVEIVAEDPVVVNPVGMAFADDGTPYVLERRPSPGDEHGEKTGPVKRTRDAVKTLGDSKGKGVYDQSKVVLEDERPTGLLLNDGWLYLCGRGTVRRYKQGKADGPYDVKETVAQGFGGYGLQTVSGMTLGPDGRLYLTAGCGENVVEGPDGSRATVLRTGAVFRCRPNGSKMQTYAIGFVNPYGDAAFDAAGDLFLADNDRYISIGGGEGKSDRGCRLLHVPEAADFDWRLGRDAPAAFAHPPGELPPMLKPDTHAASGLLIYNDSRFPEHYRGLLLYPDVEGRSIHAYKVERKGATFEVVGEFELLRSDDPLFRPCQAVLGPDGALYVVDRRGEEHGRIYRLTWAGTKDQPALPPRGMDSWAKIAGLGDDDLVKTLQGEDASDRDRARRELARRGEKERPALLKLLRDSERPDAARIAALGALESMWDGDVLAAVLFVMQKDSAADLRRLAADAVGRNAAKGDEDVHNALLRVLNDVAPEVRRSVALAMSRVAAEAAPDNLVNAWAFEESHDVYLRHGLVRAIEDLGAPGLQRLVALGESGVQKETDKVVEAFTMMRTRPAADAIPRVLENPHLGAAQRAALIRSYHNYILAPPLSLAPVVDYLKAHPREDSAVKLDALEVLSLADDRARLKDAIGVLGSDAEGARLAGRAFLDDRLPSETRSQVADALRRYADDDPAAAKLLAEITKGK